MKILVTGGTGVVGLGAVPALLERGHKVRLLSRRAKRDAKRYAGDVEIFPADVSDAPSLADCANGCEAVVHISGIAEEKPPRTTFQKVNVDGTMHLLAEAASAGVRRFVYLSSLGADTGGSAYHESKRRAEALVRDYPLEWVILRPGNVFGPGDEVASMLLKMVRGLPVVPVVDQGLQPFQPIWFKDLGRAIALSVDQPGIEGQVHELAGEEVTTTSDIIDRLSAITDRHPPQMPMPSWAAQIGTRLAEALGANRVAAETGLTLPLNSSKLQMLLEGNVIRSPEGNGLTRTFKLQATPLQDALQELATSLPELLPEEGVGNLERKRFWAEIYKSRLSAEDLMREFREHISEIMPIEFQAEPGAPGSATKGATLTGALPGRGNFQVRVEEATPTSLTLATLEGHPLAGTVKFTSKQDGSVLNFTIEVNARAANLFDWLAIKTIGSPMQNQNWTEVITRVVGLSGGEAPMGVQSTSETLGEEEAEEVERETAEVVRKNAVTVSP